MNVLLSKMERAGLLSEQDARSAESLVSQGQPVDEAILAAGRVPPEQLLRYLAEEFNVPYVDLETCKPAKEFLAQFPVHILMAHRLLPLSPHISRCFGVFL